MGSPSTHICFASLDYPTANGGSGVGSMTRSLARHLVADGYRVSVVVLADRAAASVPRENGIRVASVRIGNLHWYLSKALGLKVLSGAVRELERSWAVLKAVRTITALDPIDVVEISETGGALLPLWQGRPAMVARLHGDPYTFHRHTPQLRISASLRGSRAVQRWALRSADLLLAPSRTHAGEIGRELGSRHPFIQVIPNFTDFRRSDSGIAATDSAESTILYVGRIEVSKGIGWLLDAMARVIQTCPRARLMMAGAFHPTLPAKTFSAMVSERALEGHVVCLGHVPHEALGRCYDRAQVLVLPSYYETFGIAVLEAMQSGLPVVVSNAGALPEIVESEQTGLVVKVGSVDGLAHSLLRLLDNPCLRRRLAANALSHVTQTFQADKIVNQTIGVYQRVAKIRAAA